MTLEARNPSCWSSRQLLSLDGRPIGRVERDWLGRSFGVDLTGGHRLRFRKTHWLRDTWELRPAADDQAADPPLLTAERTGTLRNRWVVHRAAGPLTVASDSFWNSGLAATADGETVASVTWSHACRGGWKVEGDGLEPTELLTVGLLYQIVCNRAAAAAGAG